MSDHVCRVAKVQKSCQHLEAWLAWISDPNVDGNNHSNPFHQHKEKIKIIRFKCLIKA